MVLAHKLAPSPQAHAKISCPCPQAHALEAQISITLKGELAVPNTMAGRDVVEVDP